MLRNLFRLLSAPSRTSNQAVPGEIVLYAQIDRVPKDRAASDHGPRIQALPGKANLSHLKPNSNHRARLLSMRLEHIQLCSPHRCSRLQKLGILTAGDLASASPDVLAGQFRASRRAQRVLKQYRRAIRFAASVPGMMPHDAMLLISIHRRSARGLSMESAARLHRDLVRFAESSRGQAQLRGKRIPSTRRLKQWIEACGQLSPQSPQHARAA